MRILNMDIGYVELRHFIRFQYILAALTFMPVMVYGRIPNGGTFDPDMYSGCRSRAGLTAPLP